MFTANSGVLFFGAEGQTPVAWNNVSKLPEMVLDETNRAEEQNKVYATMRNSQTMTFNCHVSKKDIKQLMNIFNPRPFELAKGPYRKRMIRRAQKMRTNYIYTIHIQKGRRRVCRRKRSGSTCIAVNARVMRKARRRILAGIA